MHDQSGMCHRSPIRLAPWGHLAQMRKRCRHGERDWALFKADHEAAYKQLPIALKDRRNAIMALRAPSNGRRFGFAPRALMFSATAAVLLYNVFSRLITAIVNMMMGIPLICFFGHFAAIAHQILACKAMAVFGPF